MEKRQVDQFSLKLHFSWQASAANQKNRKLTPGEKVEQVERCLKTLELPPLLVDGN